MFKNLTIGGKLYTAFGVVLLLVTGLAGITLNRIANTADQWTELSEVVLKKQEAVVVASQALSDGIHHFKNYVIRGKEYNKQFEADMAAIEKATAQYQAQ